MKESGKEESLMEREQSTPSLARFCTLGDGETAAQVRENSLKNIAKNEKYEFKD